MKALLKVLTFTAILAVLLATQSPKSVYAAGQPCCAEGLRYCAPQNHCQSGTVCSAVPPGSPIACSSSETCIATVLDPQGICIASSVPNCDCNGDPDCGPGNTCDEGTSSGCTPFNGKYGLCIPLGGSSGGGGTLPPPAGEIDLGIFKISTDPTAMAEGFLDFGIVIGTLLAILFIIIGGYGVATSGGNPENLEKAKKQITAAVAGLLFILMSVAILNIIGVSVLGIGTF